ncbi:class I SAM-dependent methyltransferase [Candidatus Frankia alpina]|uniref:Class I SAM-dependent methyltransferase n=1 Tax=Candidatus Frankia alpina TaxID=2699483 RepID=A0A4S5ETN0_9ACTN|nr:class I SAM-dependent methyltransferase [Candidatus Frankia alpina]THJ75915.1 class I SAM-dependent methyltransferase [Candidatus Frankia alpina]
MLSRRNLSRYRNERDQLWVNVASSFLAQEGFVNLDRSVFLALTPMYPVLGRLLSPGHADLVRKLWKGRRRAPLFWFDCRKPLPFEARSVDHILCSHYLEHLPPPTAERILADYARVLRPGGTLHVILPDLRYSIDRYVTGEMDADEMLQWQHMRKVEGLRWRTKVVDAVAGLGIEHQWMYDRRTAERRILGAGFKLTDRATPSSDFRRDDPESMHLFGFVPA